MSDRSHLPLRLERVGIAAGGTSLLADLDLVIRPRRRTVVLGPNGAGKSLLLRLCHGLVRPTTGRILTGLGTEGIGPELRRRQAMVLQHPVLLRRTALANLRFVLAARNVPRHLRRPQAMAGLERFGLAHLADRPARLLSGGEQQRLALARAWLLEPELLLLDEPTSQLDPAATRAVEEAILAFAASGTTILMTTHDLGQARRLADGVVLLMRGRVVEQAPAAQFFAAPASADAAAFLRGELVI
jgi:tungstate transport system ATP-binding protein